MTLDDKPACRADVTVSRFDNGKEWWCQASWGGFTYGSQQNMLDVLCMLKCNYFVFIYALVKITTCVRFIIAIEK